MDASAVRNIVSAYEDACRRRDVDAYVGLFDDDLFWGPANLEPVRSLDGLRDRIAQIFETAEFEPAFTIEHLDLVEDMAVVVVHENGTWRNVGGPPIRTNITELFVVRKRDDRWRISRQVWCQRP